MDRKARATINRANAQKSTGPRTDAGKSIARANALKHGLSSRRLLDINGASDKEAFAVLQTAYEEEYEPRTVAEVEAVTSMIETQWQLTRVRRLLDLAFLQGGDLAVTSRMIDNYSRHQTRLHRMYRDLTERLDDLLAQRNPEKKSSGFVSQKDPDISAEADPRFVSQDNPGFVLRNDSHLIPETDPSFVLQKSPSAGPQPPRNPRPAYSKHNQLPEIGFVLQNRKTPPDTEPHEPAA